MRRKDREVAGIGAKLEIIKNSRVCRIGMVEDGQAYIVPLNFGYECINDELTLYFHGALEGKKIDILKKNPAVCFEMDGEHEFIDGEKTGSYSFAYASVIGFGIVHFLEQDDEKRHGLTVLMRHQTGQDRDFEFTPEQIRGTAVYTLKVNSFTGKRRPVV
ncbi:pyridoxamine 5'-phosphate oxidase [Spirochaetia bacterium]|nr:pyridoxamine 5'-phosphate oxidase [Spirochaetia bacterium]